MTCKSSPSCENEDYLIRSTLNSKATASMERDWCLMRCSSPVITSRPQNTNSSLHTCLSATLCSPSLCFASPNESQAKLDTCSDRFWIALLRNDTRTSRQALAKKPTPRMRTSSHFERKPRSSNRSKLPASPRPKCLGNQGFERFSTSIGWFLHVATMTKTTNPKEHWK